VALVELEDFRLLLPPSSPFEEVNAPLEGIPPVLLRASLSMLLSSHMSFVFYFHGLVLRLWLLVLHFYLFGLGFRFSGRL